MIRAFEVGDELNRAIMCGGIQDEAIWQCSVSLYN